MNELDNLYKNNINKQRIPPYQESYWQVASAFIARAEKLRKLKLIERSLSIFLVAFASLSLLGLVNINGGDKAEMDTLPMAIMDYGEKENTATPPTEVPNLADLENPAIEKEVNTTSGTQEITSTTPNADPTSQSSPKEGPLNPRSQVASTPITAPTPTERTPQINESDSQLASIASQKETEVNLPAEEILYQKSEDEARERVREMMAVSFLPYPDMSLLVEDTQFELKPFTLEGNPVRAERVSNKPYFRKSLSLGLPFAMNSGVDGGKWMGGNVSLQAEYHLNAQWMVSTGLGYALRKGPVGIIHDHPTSEYNFEMRDRGHWMSIDELHYVTIPISVHYKMNNLAVGVGYRPMGLANARAVVSSYDHHRTFSDRGVEVHTETSNEQRGWTKANGLRSFTHEFTGSVSYQIAPNWRAMASVAYNPMGNTDEGFGLRYNDVIGDYQKAYQVSRPFQAEALFAEISIQYIW